MAELVVHANPAHGSGALFAENSANSLAQTANDRMLFAGNLTKHPCFDEMRASGKGYRIVGELNNTDRIMNDTFWVGVYPGMTDEMIDYMAKTIIEAVEAK